MIEIGRSISLPGRYSCCWPHHGFVDGRIDIHLHGMVGIEACEAGMGIRIDGGTTIVGSLIMHNLKLLKEQSLA